MTENDIDKLGVALDVKTASVLLGMSQAAIYQQIKKGIFPIDVIKAGNRILIPKIPLLILLGLK